MRKNTLLTATLILGICTLPACVSAGQAVVGTVGTATKVAVGTAGVATKVAIGTAGAAGTEAIGTAAIGQRTVTAAATGAANGAAREGGKLAVRGVAAAGRAGFTAMMRDDSSISEETLAHRAGLTLYYPRDALDVGNVFEDGDRTDYTVISAEGEAANCYVVREGNAVMDAVCQPAPQ